MAELPRRQERCETCGYFRSETVPCKCGRFMRAEKPAALTGFESALTAEVDRLRAVNADLLAACKAALPELRCMYQQIMKVSIDNAPFGSVRDACDKIVAVIAKAEEHP